ncbi:uncharacterized protein LY89DRAFT_728972 [Mollisia scopiformis]|uniref:Uncharacterized protein n=1 Tax=Mollisia scopiformis TaxID=149040 RepID=A0A194XT18_MOLSC|nr:uncharacterized protein LY89DRAFT_728972 [Mollisia scopiformis]KUJ22862.1 hypothetical protein LY89DRAFT_728972 [Mollisia scopiformis]
MQQGNYTSLTRAFPRLSNLTQSTGRNPFLGGQDFTHCCLLAVNQSLSVVNGFIVENTPSFIEATVEELLSATANSQFPCGAAFNGNKLGAPVVQVPGSWLERECPGWQISSSLNQSQWITPFVGFLLPAVVFCLSVPRRRKVTIYEKLFSPVLSRPNGWIFAPFGMIMAVISSILDTIIWLSMCFAFASPMLLSGFYEAYLDSLLLHFIHEQSKARMLTLDMKVRLLFVVLCGNLDLDPDLDSKDTLQVLHNHQSDSEHWPNYERNPISGPFNNNSAWTHIEYMIQPVRTYRDMAFLTPRQWPMHDIKCGIQGCIRYDCLEVPLPRTPDTLRQIAQMKTRLRTMLACQPSFGASVGAPVAFFLGAFVFTIAVTLNSHGDHDTSIEIAFGMWFMLIPHEAIVSGLLLAGNNPNTLEGMLAHDIEGLGDIYSEAERRNPFNEYFALAYQSRYRPKWLWSRGRSKRDWIDKVWTNYWYKDGPEPYVPICPSTSAKDLKKETSMGLKGWATILALSIMLLETPYVLAFMTAFYTPKVGFSCRTLTFTSHAINQIFLMCLWFWAWSGAPETCPRYLSFLSFLKKGSWLDRSGFYTPTTTYLAWRSPKTRFTMRSVWAVIWFGAATVLGLSTVFVTIGGTFMQLIGVYRSDFCDFNELEWTRPHGNVLIVISTNTALDIKDASQYWMSTGITATVFLAVVCFGGWWYQRRLQALFQNVVSDLDNLEYERADIVTTSSKLKRGQRSVRASTR